MTDTIKKLRRSLDGLALMTEILRNSTCQIFQKDVPCASNEVVKAINSITLCKMWLGKVLKEMGIANPYPESKNHHSQVIEKTADTKEDGEVSYLLPENFYEMTPTYQCKWLRAELESIENEIRKLYMDPITTDLWVKDAYINSLRYSSEAGMWLGMELSNIRNKQAVSEAH